MKFFAGSIFYIQIIELSRLKMVIICFKAFVQNDLVLSYFVYCLMFGPFQSNRRLQIKNNIIYTVKNYFKKV